MAKSEMDPSELVEKALLVNNLRSLGSSLQLSDSQLRDKLTIHFQRRKFSRGGDVSEVFYPLDSSKDNAIVIFEDVEDRESAVKHEQVFHGQSIIVSRLPPVFTSIKAEIDPLYFNLMPFGTPDEFLTSFQKITNVNFDKANVSRISCSKPIELEHVKKEIIWQLFSHGDAASNNTHMMYNDSVFESAGASSYKATHVQQRDLKENGDRFVEVMDDELVKEEGSEPIESFSKWSDDPEVIRAHTNARLSVINNPHDKSEINHSSTAVQEKQAVERDGNTVDGSRPTGDISMVLDKYTYKYLTTFKHVALDKILKAHNVHISVNPAKTGHLEGVFVSSGLKTKAKNVAKVRDEFITFYQKAHVDIMRKRIDCSTVDRRSVEDAAKRTQHKFYTDTLITEIDGCPDVRLILRRGDVEEVARQFRLFAGIKSRKTLRTGTVGADVKSTHEPDITTKSTQDDNTGTLQGQLPTEPHHHQSTSHKSSVQASQDLKKPNEMNFVTNEGMNICVRQDDIIKQHAHAVVNPSDCNLQGAGGGVAHAILSAAGPELKGHCSQIMMNRKSQVKLGECIVTPGFKLNYEAIIHVCGPTFHHKSINKDLHQTFLNCLCTAETNKLPSLAMPLIGSGSIGVPKKVCADALAFALLEFSCGSSNSKVVHDVYLVNIDAASTFACQQSLQAAFNTFNKASFEARYTSSTDGRTDGTAETGFPKTPTLTGKPPFQASQTPLPSNSQQVTGMVGDDNGGQPKEGFIKTQKRNDQQGSSTGNTSNEAYGNIRESRGTVAADTSVSPTSTQADPLKANTGDTTTDDKDNKCPICLADDIVDVKFLDKCNHKFCKKCIDQALQNSYRCPVCQSICKQPRGTQPDGTMQVYFDKFTHLPGYLKDGCITIRYDIPRGTQMADHPNPGRPFAGATRTAYLPDNNEGRVVLHLFKKAFDARLVFTVGRSVTSGIDDIVTWNDIHHKTSIYDGPTSYGYPDEGYLKRVKEDLAVKGIE